MKCKVCGAESGKYPLCRICNVKKENGEIIKCEKCNNWHYVSNGCFEDTEAHIKDSDNTKYLYRLRNTLVSKSEQGFYTAISEAVPDGFRVFPQINLASFIDRTDDARFHNELFRNVDFLITDSEYRPKIIVEINDQTHFNSDRKERDEKVRKICEEAGIPIIKLWTSYGINDDYIKGKIEETLRELPIKRVHHFGQSTESKEPIVAMNVQKTSNKKKGCYIATCVYGSYDCPEVWVLRRFRDGILSTSWFGRVFVEVYYAFSPTIVKAFGKSKWFINLSKAILDRLVNQLQSTGLENTPYYDT